MFTGIVEELGTVKRIQKGQSSAILTIQACTVMEDIKLGDSIAVNGVCLTVTSFHSGEFTADVMHETLKRSALKQLRCGSPVNLERAVPAYGRFGGHIVAGHVDGVGKILDIRHDDTAIWYKIQAEPPVMRYIIEKGSITVDGISLTVAQVAPDHFSVSTIPHTLQMTTLSRREKGDWVNLENDMVGKYVEKLLQPGPIPQTQGALSKDYLAQCGF